MTNQAGIYLISSLVNNKYYVGQAVNINKRWIGHNTKLNTNTHHSKYLQRHYNKHGKDMLVYSVLEVINNPTKELLAAREQYWMDLLKPEFNSCPAAGSSLNRKTKGSKYYSYHKDSDCYVVRYKINGKSYNFSCHSNEKEAQTEVEYIKALTDEEIIAYSKECKGKPKKRSRVAKHYNFNKKLQKWKITINRKHYGYYTTEQEAINKVKQLRIDLNIK
jgi:group I intron endonuclease